MMRRLYSAVKVLRVAFGTASGVGRRLSAFAVWLDAAPFNIVEILSNVVDRGQDGILKRFNYFGRIPS